LSSRWRHGRLVAGTVMAAAVMALAACAWVQTSYWKNSETLWLHTIASTGSNAVAENNLANFLNAQERVDEAIPHLRKALEINPGYPDARNNLGVNLQYKGLAAEAIVQYKIALAMRPGNPTFMNNLSWLLATWPDPSIRDGPRAIELASEADRISGGSSPEILETLAAAYAETGRFRDASDTAGWAMVVAANEGKARLVDEIRAEMQFYQKRMPYREKTKF